MCNLTAFPDAKVSSAQVDVGISEHTDYEVFSIMHQDSAGLQIRTPSRGTTPGTWHQLASRPDTFTVIIGVSGTSQDGSASLWTRVLCEELQVA